MKKRMLPWLLTLSPLILASCSISIITPDNSKGGNSDDSSGGPATSSDGSSNSGGANTSENSQPSHQIAAPNFAPAIRASKDDVIFDDLFNLNNRLSVTIDVDKEELDKIAEDNDRGPKPEIYRYAKKVTISLVNGDNTFTWELTDVGIRQKGNLSRGPIFNGDDLNTENHYKLSFDETFTDEEIYGSEFVALHGDAERGDREFLGMTGLDFKWNRNWDSTHIKEIYANELYRACGVLAQKVGLSTLQMNYGERTASFGLCFVYEQTSKSFIKRAFSSGEDYINCPTWKQEKSGAYGVPDKKYGDFYKVTYGNGNGANGGGDLSLDSIAGNRVGVKTDIWGNDYPAYERKTNKDDEYDDGLLKSAVNTIVKKSYGDIEKVVDLDYFAIEAAVAYFLGNPDDMRYNYNNYMIYIRRVDGKMIFVPIDNDRTFGIGHTWDKGVYFSADINTTPSSPYDVSGNYERNALFTKTILASGDNEAKALYLETIEKIASSAWVEPNTFASLFEVAKATYDEYSYDFNLSGGEDNISFASYIQKKLQSIEREFQGGQSSSENSSKEDLKPIDQTPLPVADLSKFYLSSSFNEFGDGYSKLDDAAGYFLSPSSTNEQEYELTFVVGEPSYPGAFDEGTVVFNFRDTAGENWSTGNIIAACKDNPWMLIATPDFEHYEVEMENITVAADPGDMVKITLSPNSRRYNYQVTKA